MRASQFSRRRSSANDGGALAFTLRALDNVPPSAPWEVDPDEDFFAAGGALADVVVLGTARLPPRGMLAVAAEEDMDTA